MSMNVVCLEGRIPFDFEIKNAGEKNAFIGMNVSVKRNYKPEGEQYYPEDLIYCKFFGPKADFVSNYFNKGDGITIQGEVRRDDDRPDPNNEGEVIRGQMYVNVVNVFFPEKGAGNGEGSSNNSSKSNNSKKPATKTNSKSGAKSAGKGLNPLAGGKKPKLPF